MENLHTPDCIRTVSGVYVNVFKPDPDMFNLNDIAHALSQIPRFGGHLPKFYSVAQHSIMCALAIEDESLRFDALMHDAAEAYLLDMPGPIKRRMKWYKKKEAAIMRILAKKFGFTYPKHPEVDLIDKQMLQAEWDYLMLGGNGSFFKDQKSMAEVKREFLHLADIFNPKNPFLQKKFL